MNCPALITSSLNEDWLLVLSDEPVSRVGRWEDLHKFSLLAVSLRISVMKN